MKLSKAKRETSVAFNMTPMIDIVFLLIIFFMTVSQINRTVDHPVDLPVVKMGTSPSKPSSVTINLDQTGKVIVGGQAMAMQVLVAALKKQLSEVNNDTTQIKIQIRCDRRCKAQFVNEIIDELVALGFQNVREAIAIE